MLLSTRDQVIDRHWGPLTADLAFVLRGGSGAASREPGSSSSGSGSGVGAAAAFEMSGAEVAELHLRIAQHLLSWLANRG